MITVLLALIAIILPLAKLLKSGGPCAHASEDPEPVRSRLEVDAIV